MISEAKNRPMGRFFGVNATSEPLVPRTWSSAAALNPAGGFAGGLGIIPGTQVDIFLSAGIAEEDGPSCDTGDQGNCGLYRVRWDLDRQRVVEVEQVAPPWRFGDLAAGIVEAAVRESDGALVWLVRGHARPSAGGTPWEERGTTSLVFSDGRRVSALHSGERPSDRPQFPWFRSESVVLFSKANRDADGLAWRNLWSVHTDGTGLRERTDFVASRISFGNPQVGTGTAAGKVLSFGLEGGRGINPNPHVTDVDGNVLEEFDLRWSDVSFQHPAWSPSGDEIVAGRHVEQDDAYERGRRQELLHRFTFDGDWRNRGRAFEPLKFEDFPQAFGGLAGDVIVYKYPHGCGDERHLVATVFSRARGDGGDDRPEMSRVLLIRLPDVEGEEPTYFDLTREVAYAFPEVAGPRLWRGIFSVCRTVSA